jgi:hypothetical protein
MPPSLAAGAAVGEELDEEKRGPFAGHLSLA